jgi:serine/threonine protein kinase
MSKQRDRAPLSTATSPRESEIDTQLPDRGRSERPDDEGVRGFSNGSKTAAPDEKLAIGQTLSGRYRIERELNEGGMGVVYLVSDQQVVGETFAVKVLKDALDPQALQLLREEVRQTRKLSHPNIVDMHSVNVDGKRLYVLMEYLEGKSLDKLLDEEFGRGMPLSRAWPIIEDVGAALGYAHDHNVIHSDLKPANVFVTTSGRTKLLDFGIARVSRGPLLHKQSGPLALTPAYASCEMLEGKEADRRDDIYPFASVIYEMLSGERPFGELTALEAREAGSQVPPLEMLTRGQNAALANALAFDRERRTSSVEKLLKGLGADKRFRARPIGVLGGAMIAALAALGLTYLALDKLWISRHSVMVQSVTPVAQPAASPASARASIEVAPVHKPRLAILPFENLSPNPANAFFADGLHEEILTTLAQYLPSVEVISRTTMMSYRHDPPKPLATVARELGASHLVEGSVRREANKVRLTLQLIDARTDRHIWSQNYDRTLSNALTLQSDVAGEVASQLLVRLAGDLQDNPTFKTQSPEAYDGYLRARVATRLTYLASRRDEWETILMDLDDAVLHDPNFTPAHLLRMDVGVQMFMGSYDKSDKRLRQIRDDLAAAQRLAPNHPWVLLAQAAYRLHIELDLVRTLESLRAAQSVGVTDSGNLVFLASGFLCLGRHDEALPIYQHASTLDPHNPLPFAMWAVVLRDLHRPADALRVIDLAIGLHGPFQEDRGEVLFAFTGQTPPWRAGADSVLPKFDPGYRLAVEFEVMRFEHRYADLRQLLSGAAPEFIRMDPTPLISGLAPTALYRGWNDLLLGDQAAAAAEGKVVVRFAESQKETKWNRTFLRDLLAEGNTLQGNRSAAIAAARQVLAFAPRRTDPVGWAFFAAPREARVLAWSGAQDEAAALLDELADATPSDGPAKITRDPLYSVPLAGNKRYEQITDRLEARIRAVSPQLSTMMAQSGSK